MIRFQSLCKRKFTLNFEETLNPPCPCSIEPETTKHFFLHYYFCSVIQANFVSDLLNKDSFLLIENGEKLVGILLYDKIKFIVT